MTRCRVHHRRLVSRRYCAGGSGFTLVELMVSVAMVAILSVAMGSAVLIASHSMDQRESSAARTVVAADAVERIRAELRLATGFLQRSGNAVIFNVPDRDGDGVDEAIGYSWSGQSGTSLTRTYNNAPPEIVAEDVRDFNLSYLVQTLQPSRTPGPLEGTEILLIAHDDAPGGSLRTFLIDSNDMAAQYFKPALPANTVGWKITRVQVMARNEKNTDGVLYFWITAANSSLKPAYPIYETVEVAESKLPNAFNWFEVGFTQLEDLDPSQGLCLVVGYRSGNAKIGTLQYEEAGNPMTANTHWMQSSDGGSSFSAPTPARDLRFKVYGTATTEEP
jgi:prepilin-type N-terminal cleavage/methylation domain-containing protein